MMHYLTNLFKSEKKSISLTENGIEIQNGNKRLDEFNWDETKRIVAFKRDLLTHDIICLEFDLGIRSIEVNEEMSGYRSLIDKLKVTFNTLEVKWYEKVVNPPFETSATVLWKKG